MKAPKPGYIAWITGGGTGIGQSLALQLAKRGATVWISGRRETPLAETAKLAVNGQIRPLPVDVTNRTAVTEAAHHIVSQSGCLDLAIMNAGDYKPMSLAEFDLDLFHELCAVNYLGAINGLAAVLPIMQTQRSGQILLNASLSGYRGLPRAAPYGATKAALINVAEALRNECLAEGIKLRVVNPGFVRSPLTDKNDFRMPSLLEPEEAAAAILARLEDDSFEITFPRGFALLMKLLRLLPYRAYFPIIRRLQK